MRERIVTVTNRDGEQFTCCYTLSDAGFVPPSVSFNFSNCGSMVTAVINGNGWQLFLSLAE